MRNFKNFWQEWGLSLDNILGILGTGIIFFIPVMIRILVYVFGY